MRICVLFLKLSCRVYTLHCRHCAARTICATRFRLLRGNVGKQMMLDLIIEPAVDEVDQPVVRYVARREHVFPEKAACAAIRQRHALVVASKGAGHVQAGPKMMHQRKRESTSGAE